MIFTDFENHDHDGINSPLVKVKRTVQCIIFGFSSAITTGDGKFYFHIDRILDGMRLEYAHARVITAGTTGTTDIQVANVTRGVDLFSTKLTIDSGETGSDTAASRVKVNQGANGVNLNDVMRIDVDAVSTTPPQGLIVTLGFN